MKAAAIPLIMSSVFNKLFIKLNNFKIDNGCFHLLMMMMNDTLSVSNRIEIIQNNH